MIKSKSEHSRYRTLFTNRLFEAYAGTTGDKGGGNAGFRPHDLLEAALATCLNMAIRNFADHHNIQLDEVNTQVWLDRSRPDETVFKYSIVTHDPISGEQRQKLIQVAKGCSIHRTLSKKLSFEHSAEV